MSSNTRFPSPVFPPERVLICVFPACAQPSVREPDFHTAPSSDPAPRLTVKPGGEDRFLRPAHPASSRCQRGAQGSALGQPTHILSHTRTHTHTQSFPPLLAEDGLCRRNSTEPQLFLSPTASSISPAARKLDRRSSPAGLTVRAAVCVGEE